MNTREQVKQLRQEHPDWTLERIASKTTVTRERVRQLLKACNLPTRRVYNSRYKCIHCQKKVSGKNVLCLECRKLLHYKSVPCAFCGKTKMLRQAEARRTVLNFCDRHCHGKWLGTNFNPQTRKAKMDRKNKIYAFALKVANFIRNAVSKEKIAVKSEYKAYCKYGHEKNDLNTYIRPSDGVKICRKCDTIRRYARSHGMSFALALKIRNSSAEIKSKISKHM